MLKKAFFKTKPKLNSKQKSRGKNPTLSKPD